MRNFKMSRTVTALLVTLVMLLTGFVAYSEEVEKTGNLLVYPVPASDFLAGSRSGVDLPQAVYDVPSYEGKIVRINIDMIPLLKEGDEVTVDVGENRFDVVTTSVKIDKNTGTVTWTGEDKRSAESGLTVFIISVVEGKVSGLIQTTNEQYNVIPTNNVGEGVVQNTANMVPVRDGEVIPLNSGDKRSEIGSSIPFILSNKEFTVADGQQTKNYIDVLAIYSTGLKSYLGSESNVKAEIQKVVAYANTSFVNSGVNVEVRIVGYREVTLANEDLTEAIRIAGAGNPNFPVKSWADEVGADQVTFFLRFVYPSNYCGLGHMPSSLGAYGQTSYQIASSVAIGSYSPSPNITYYCPVDTFTHELGHNFGCNHDRAHASGSGMTSYAYGYCGSNYGTIMSYCHPRVPYYSDNRVVDGKVIGDASTRNAEVIRLTAPYLASTRPSKSNNNENGVSTFSVSGSVKLIGSKTPLKDVFVYAKDANGTEQGFGKTDVRGNWQIGNLVQGETYTIIPVKSGYTFSPESVVVSSFRSNIEFSGKPIVGANFNPIPDTIYLGSRYTFSWQYLYGNGAPAGWKFILYVTDSNGNALTKYRASSNRSRNNQMESVSVYFNPRTFPVGNYTALICVSDFLNRSVNYCDSRSFKLLKK